MQVAKLPYGQQRLSLPDPSWIDLDVEAPSGHTPGQPSSTGTGGDYLWGVAGAYGLFQYGDGLFGDSIWWDFETATGGVWDLKFRHVTGYDCGIISVRLDGREIALVDMYGTGDTADVIRDVTGIPIGAGRHRISLHAIDANPSAHGQAGEWVPYFRYATIQRITLRRTAILPALKARPRPSFLYGPVRRRVYIDPIYADGNLDWAQLDIMGVMSTRFGSLGASRWWTRDLAAGDWDVEIYYAKGGGYGIFALLVDGVEAGRIDGYGTDASGLRAAPTKATIRVTVPTSGRHELRVTVVDYNPSATNVTAWIRSIVLRQVRAKPGTVQSIHPGVVDMDVLWSHGNTGWTAYTGHVAVIHWHYLTSSGSAGDRIWWYQQIPKGTYTADIVYGAFTNRGVITIWVDDVPVGYVNSYAGSSLNNQRATFSGIVIPTTGIHKVMISVDDKDPLSSSYVAIVNALQLRKTSNNSTFYPPMLLDQIPTMTSNTAPLGVASASSELAGGGYEAFCAFNVAGGNARGWLNNVGGSPQWLRYDFPAAVTINHYLIRPWWFNVFPGRTPATWKFQGSNNGATWTDLDSQTSWNWLGNSTNVISFAVASPGSYRYYRLYVTANGGDSYTGVGSLQMTVA